MIGLAATSLHAADGPAPDWMTQQTRGMIKVNRVYTNTNYGFLITIPPGSHAFMDAAPSPNHGVKIILGDHRTIEVSAEFDAASYGSSEGVLNAYIRDEHASGITRTTTLLGGKSAVRARFSIEGGREDVVARWIDRSPDDAINVTAALTTTQLSDEDVFSTVLASFRYVKQSSE